jgi:hypothetical protein
VSGEGADQATFVTLVRTAKERSRARVLIDSIRSFGGVLSSRPIWVFETAPQEPGAGSLEDTDVFSFPLSVPEGARHYLFADKVRACAVAEEMAAPNVRSLVWIDPACLVIRPPLLYDLGPAYDAAVRPVHIRNVGLLADEPLDRFWEGVCEAAGVRDIRTTVETFVDGERVRSYFNSHVFSMNPSRGLLRRWWTCFESLVCDAEYQESACRDERHQVFLHQAVWTALLVADLDPARVRELPPDYNYPYNLHQSVPPGRRAAALNDLVSIACESRSLDPSQVDDIEIHEPLRSWLSARASDGGPLGRGPV